MPRKVEFRVQNERFFGNARGRKRNSYVIPVWSGKTVLEMLFVESTSLIRPIYMALRSKPLTESDCRIVSHDSKNVHIYTTYCCLTPTAHQCNKFPLFTFSQTYTNKSFETLFVCFDGLSVKRQHLIFQTSFWTNLKFKRIPADSLKSILNLVI